MKWLGKIVAVAGVVVVSMATMGSRVDSRLELSEEERAWMEEHPVIRVGLDVGYPPAIFLSESGVIQGIDVDFLESVAELTGLQFEFVRFDSWPAAITAVRERRVDMLTCMTMSTERETFLEFTEIYYDFPIAIITRSDAEFLSTPSAMRGKQIAVPDGFVTHEVMRSIGWDVEVKRVPTIADAYFAVSTGQCYATVANLGNASYMIPRLGISNLKISGVMPASTSSRFAVRKDWPELRTIFNRYFASLSDVERSAVVERWVRLEVAQGFDWGFVLRVGLGLVVFGGGVIWTVVWRNRQLRRQLEERERYQAALEEAHDRVSRLSEEKSDLLHMVAHDMRGPLMTFQTGVSLITDQLSGPDQTDTREVLRRLERQSEAMQGLVNGLLDVEAIENGSRRLTAQAVNFRAVVEQVVERFQEVARRKEIAVEWSAPVGVSKVTGDLVAIQQVVENLLSNALKYTPPGGRVQLRLAEQGEVLRFEIQDTGPGISPDEVGLLFQKFSRLSARPTDGESSHGIGLYIVAALVKSMDGRVWCESQLGKGATFLVTLPRA